MNTLYQNLYYEASLQCINEGKSDAWAWEKRYAELIVQECIKACEDSWHFSAGASQRNIKEHFGMEEN